MSDEIKMFVQEVFWLTQYCRSLSRPFAHVLSVHQDRGENRRRRAARSSSHSTLWSPDSIQLNSSLLLSHETIIIHYITMSASYIPKFHYSFSFMYYSFQFHREWNHRTQMRGSIVPWILEVKAQEGGMLQKDGLFLFTSVREYLTLSQQNLYE